MANRFLSEEHLQKLRDRLEFLDVLKQHVGTLLPEDQRYKDKLVHEHSVPYSKLGKSYLDLWSEDIDREEQTLRFEISALSSYLLGE